MRRALILIALLAACAAFAAWLAARPSAPVPSAARALPVSATFYPLAEAVREVGGSRVEVTTLTPPGAEPHDFEPSPRDIAGLASARVFVMNGGVDAWADRLLPELRASGVVVARVADLLPEVGEDPHVWLDPRRMQTIVEAVRDALIAADPEGADAYRANADAFVAELAAIDRAYEDGLRDCDLRAVVSSHDALGYLAGRYGFEVVSVTGISPEEEPSPRRMAEIAEAARAAGVKHVFFEELLSPKISETVAEAIGADLLEFDPVEGLSEEDRLAGKDYASIMSENLETLRTALACR